MKLFQTVREAKEYLVHRTIAQAERDSVPLSETERKMLYFSETGWTLPDMMAISQEFDQAYDQNEYERKIGQIIRRIHDQQGSRRDNDHWDDAVQRLREEDHYLLVLIDGSSGNSAKRPRQNTARLILAGVLVVAAFFPIFFFVDSHISDPEIAKLIGKAVFLALVVFAWLFSNRRYGGWAKIVRNRSKR